MKFSPENISHVIFLVTGLGLSIISGTYFITRKTDKSRNLFLALFLFSLNSSNINWIFRLSNLFEKYPNLACLPTNFYFFVVPLLYLYCLKLFNRYSKTDLWHLLPGALMFILEFGMMLLPIETILVLHKTNAVIRFIYNDLVAVFGVSYSIIVITRLRAYRELLPDFYASLGGKKLFWLEVAAFICLAAFAWSYILIEYLKKIVPYNQTLQIGYSIPIILVAFIPFFAVRYHKNSNLIKGLKNEDKPLQNLSKQHNLHKESFSGDGIVDTDNYNHIVKEFTQNKIHTNPELTLFMLADTLDMSYKDVSRIINNKGGKNFNQFVNEFRVQEAKKLLLDKSKDHFDLTGIAELAGFSSRSTFFKYFKEIEGITPSSFKKLNN